MAKKKGVTQKEFAKMLGVSAPYINKLVNKGIIKLKNKRIDPDIARAAIKAASEPTRQSAVNDIKEPAGDKAGKSPHLSLIKSRAIKEHYKAGITKLEYEEMNGRLVDAEKFLSKVDETLEKTLYAVRQRLLAVPVKGQQRFTPIVAPGALPEVKGILEDLILECMKDLTSIDVEKLMSGKKKGK